MDAIEPLLKLGTLALASAVEVAAATVISGAVVQAFAGAARLFVQSLRREEATALYQTLKEVVRLRLGRWLALALEFELAADILRTAVAPSWEEIGQLAAIATLRTALNFFLEREIEHAERSASRLRN